MLDQQACLVCVPTDLQAHAAAVPWYSWYQCTIQGVAAQVNSVSSGDGKYGAPCLTRLWGCSHVA